MDPVLLLLILLGALAIFWTFSCALVLVTLWYTAHHGHTGEEYRYTGRLLQHGWRGGRVWQTLRRWMNHTYIPCEALVKKDEYNSVLYVAQPHGMMALSAALTFLSGAADRPAHKPVLLVVHDFYFRCPLLPPPLVRWLGWDRDRWSVPTVGLRNLMLALGCIDRRIESIAFALAQGFDVAVLPGGVLEMGPPLFPVPRPLPILKHARAPWFTSLVVPVQLRGEEDVCWVWHGEWCLIRLWRKLSYQLLGLFLFQPLVPRLHAWIRGKIKLNTICAPIPMRPHEFETLHDLQLAYEAWGKPED